MARTKTTNKSARREREDTEERNVIKRARIDNTFEVIFLSRDSAYLRYIKEYENKKIIKGRVFDFQAFGEEGLNLEVNDWLKYQGWEEFVTYSDSCYPRLVRALVSNLAPSTKKSWIGNVEIDLSVDSIRRCFNLPESDTTEIEWPTSRGKLFSDLAEVEISEKENYLHASHLNLNLRLAYSVVINNVYPRFGATHSVSEKDAKILWALKHKKKINLAQVILDQLYLVKASRRFPLPYGIAFSKLLREAGVNVSVEKGEPIKATDKIDQNAVKRIGFRLTAEGWVSDKPRRQDQIRQPSQEDEEATAEEAQNERQEIPVERVQEPSLPEEDHAAPISLEAVADSRAEEEEEEDADGITAESESEDIRDTAASPSTHRSFPSPPHHFSPSQPSHTPPPHVQPFTLSKQPSQAIPTEPQPNTSEDRLNKLENSINLLSVSMSLLHSKIDSLTSIIESMRNQSQQPPTHLSPSPPPRPPSPNPSPRPSTPRPDPVPSPQHQPSSPPHPFDPVPEFAPSPAQDLSPSPTTHKSDNLEPEPLPIPVSNPITTLTVYIPQTIDKEPPISQPPPTKSSSPIITYISSSSSSSTTDPDTLRAELHFFQTPHSFLDVLLPPTPISVIPPSKSVPSDTQPPSSHQHSTSPTTTSVQPPTEPRPASPQPTAHPPTSSDPNPTPSPTPTTLHQIPSSDPPTKPPPQPRVKLPSKRTPKPRIQSPLPPTATIPVPPNPPFQPSTQSPPPPTNTIPVIPSPVPTAPPPPAVPNLQLKSKAPTQPRSKRKTKPKSPTPKSPPQPKPPPVPRPPAPKKPSKKPTTKKPPSNKFRMTQSEITARQFINNTIILLLTEQNRSFTTEDLPFPEFENLDFLSSISIVPEPPPKNYKPDPPPDLDDFLPMYLIQTIPPPPTQKGVTINSPFQRPYPIVTEPIDPYYNYLPEDTFLERRAANANAAFHREEIPFPDLHLPDYRSKLLIIVPRKSKDDPIILPPPHPEDDQPCPPSSSSVFLPLRDPPPNPIIMRYPDYCQQRDANERAIQQHKQTPYPRLYQPDFWSRLHLLYKCDPHTRLPLPPSPPRHPSSPFPHTYKRKPKPPH